MNRLTEIVAALLGAALTIYLQTKTGWWLNSGRAVLLTAAALFGLAVIVGAVGAGPRERRLWALAIGAQIGLLAYLVSIGPGTIWPIVMIINVVISGGVIVLGGGLGMRLNRA